MPEPAAEPALSGLRLNLRNCFRRYLQLCQLFNDRPAAGGSAGLRP